MGLYETFKEIEREQAEKRYNSRENRIKTSQRINEYIIRPTKDTIKNTSRYLGPKGIIGGLAGLLLFGGPLAIATGALIGKNTPQIKNSIKNTGLGLYELTKIYNDAIAYENLNPNAEIIFEERKRKKGNEDEVILDFDQSETEESSSDTRVGYPYTTNTESKKIKKVQLLNKLKQRKNNFKESLFDKLYYAGCAGKRLNNIISNAEQYRKLEAESEKILKEKGKIKTPKKIYEEKEKEEQSKKDWEEFERVYTTLNSMLRFYDHMRKQAEDRNRQYSSDQKDKFQTEYSGFYTKFQEFCKKESIYKNEKFDPSLKWTVPNINPEDMNFRYRNS